VKVTELCEPTGDVMNKYIYNVNVMNPNTRMFDVPNFVGQPQQYKAELVAISSWWMKEMITVSKE